MGEEFGEDISKHSDDELLEMVNVRFGDYAQAVIDGAKRELEARGFKLLRTGTDFELINPSGIKFTSATAISNQTEFQPDNKKPDTEVRVGLVDNAPVDFRYRGVGGWLMFFVITLVLIRPLMLCAALGQYERVWGPHYDAYPFLKTIHIINLVIGLGTLGFSIYAGVSLLRTRPNAVQIAKSYLLVSAVALMLTGGPLLLLAGLPEGGDAAILQALPVDTLKGLVYPAVWYLYLSRSKRVATTYAPYNVVT